MSDAKQDPAAETTDPPPGAATEAAADPANNAAAQTGPGSAAPPADEPAAEHAAAERDDFGLRPLPSLAPSDEDLAAHLEEGKRQFGDGFITRMHAAILSMVGIRTDDSRRLAYLLTAAKDTEDAVTRCGDVIDNMHGSDEQRRQVALRLKARFGG